MATLVRTSSLQRDIPAPFPTHLLDNDNDIRACLIAVERSSLTTLASILAIPVDNDTDTLARLVRALGHGDDDTTLLAQLRHQVDAIAPSLDSLDARLSQAIVALVLDLHQLPPSLAHLEPDSSLPDHPSSASPYTTIASLQRQLSSLQPSSSSESTPESIRSALYWARIDDQLDTIVSLCRARASSARNALRPSFDDTLPPDYDAHYPYELPPSYVQDDRAYASSDEKNTAVDQYPPEKVLSRDAVPCTSTSLDLDAVTHAIERLYVVAPQLANQRVELRREKIVQMENAKLGKGKARTLVDTADPELDKLLDLLGKASAREIPDQSVVIDPHRAGREKGTADIEEQRRKYLEHLVHRSHAGRLHTQDAIPSLDRACSSDALRNTDLDHMLLDETASRDGKRASYPVLSKSDSALGPLSGRLRNRSLSAPHISWPWLRDKSSNDGLNSMTRSLSSDPKNLSALSTLKSARSISQKLRCATKSQPSSEDVSSGALDISYIAEHHETLKHVLLFIAYTTSSGSPSNGAPSAEVLPSTSSGTHGDCLFLRLSGTPSPPLALPVPVIPGSKTVLSRSGHWEVKATCHQTGVSKEREDVSLLSASQLSSLSPSSYACLSCSLPLVPAPPVRYRDLPSEHWEELIDAWMCHPEGQSLAKTAMHGTGKGHSFGFWPTRDEAYVGGSYILFDAEAVAGGNIRLVGGRERGSNIRLARCLCGAVLGKQHERKQEDGSVSRMYRLFKYAIRPISATSQVPKIPMSAFVLQDMLEHVHAHATYRFVLSDDEDEKPRLLIWLFKPRLRISYMLPTSALLPKSGTIEASKALYKILGPTSSTSGFKEILGKYPGFAQAEYLFYPMDVCRKLAALLKESTLSYPEGVRTMTGLNVGWLSMS